VVLLNNGGNKNAYQFLVSGELKNGTVRNIAIRSEKDEMHGPESLARQKGTTAPKRYFCAIKTPPRGLFFSNPAI
jgi:hypothetical protein